MRAWMEHLGGERWAVHSQRWLHLERERYTTIAYERTEHDTYTGAYIEWLVRRGD